MTDDRPARVRSEDLAIHGAIDGAALDRKMAALAAMPSQTEAAVTQLGAATYAAMVAEEAFVDAGLRDGR